jgi:hypothetical protein
MPHIITLQKIKLQSLNRTIINEIVGSIYDNRLQIDAQGAAGDNDFMEITYIHQVSTD